MSPRLGADYRRLWAASVISNLGDGVSTVAYPWLASAVTRDPLQIALIGVATRLPWLVFSLPAGVITDRLDRRRLVAVMDGFRFAVTMAVAIIVFAGRESLSRPVDIVTGAATPPAHQVVYLAALYVAALLFGFAEVLRDNAAQSLMPSIVEPEALERANGRLWGAEMVMNSFLGPPWGGFLIAISLALPFFFDASTFAISAVLILTMRGSFRARGSGPETPRRRWTVELKEGMQWLWHHRLLRSLALILGLMNALSSLAFATAVLFAQEILDLEAASFGVLLTGGAVGGVVGSFSASWISSRFGSGTSILASLAMMIVAPAVIGLTSASYVVWAMLAMISFGAVLWNVITVSLRQTIIPDRLLGRVNSVYRFFAWGMMPVGLFMGGLIVRALEALVGREAALRAPFLVTAAVHAALLVYAVPRLNTRQIEAARRATPLDGL